MEGGGAEEGGKRGGCGGRRRERKGDEGKRKTGKEKLITSILSFFNLKMAGLLIELIVLFNC